jgi:sugar phosphate permease
LRKEGDDLPPADQRAKFRKYRVTICLIIFSGYILVFFHRLCPAVIALDMQDAFGLSGTLLGLLGSFYFYPYAIMQLPTGLLADSWGPRKTVSTFFVLAGAGSVLMGLAPDVRVAILGRLLVGIGVSTLFVCNFKLLAEWFHPKQFVVMGGIFMAMGGIGALSSAAPLAWLSNLLGWRLALVAVGSVTLVMATLIYAFVRNRPADVGLPPIITSLDRKAKHALNLLEGLKLVAFSGRFWPIAIWTFFSAGMSFALGGLWGGPYLMHVYGMSKTAAGGVLSMFALALILGSPIVSVIANRFGRKPVTVGCSLVLIMVFSTFTLFTDRLTLPMLYVLFFFLCLCGGALGQVVAAISKELFPPSIAGTSVGIVNLFPFFGGAIFQVVIGSVLTKSGQVDARYALIGYQHMFLLCLIGAVLSLGAALLLRETLDRQAHDRGR